MSEKLDLNAQKKPHNLIIREDSLYKRLKKNIIELKTFESYKSKHSFYQTYLTDNKGKIITNKTFYFSDLKPLTDEIILLRKNQLASLWLYHSQILLEKKESTQKLSEVKQELTEKMVLYLIARGISFSIYFSETDRQHIINLDLNSSNPDIVSMKQLIQDYLAKELNVSMTNILTQGDALFSFQRQTLFISPIVLFQFDLYKPIFEHELTHAKNYFINNENFFVIEAVAGQLPGLSNRSLYSRLLSFDETLAYSKSGIKFIENALVEMEKPRLEQRTDFINDSLVFAYYNLTAIETLSDALIKTIPHLQKHLESKQFQLRDINYGPSIITELTVSLFKLHFTKKTTNSFEKDLDNHLTKIYRFALYYKQQSIYVKTILNSIFDTHSVIEQKALIKALLNIYRVYDLSMNIPETSFTNIRDQFNQFLINTLEN